MSLLQPRPAAAPVLRLEAIEQFYDRRIRILGPLDLEMCEGEFLSLVGPSGCGKSTLVRIIAGILRPSHGRVCFGGGVLSGVNRRVSVVFQSFALFPWVTVVENVGLGVGARGIGLRERVKRAGNNIRRGEVSAHCVDRNSYV